MYESDLVLWLLDSDPSLRWQVQRDVLGAEEAIWAAERRKLEHEGWCAYLLGLQDPDGLWNGSLYNGKWLSTTYTLYLLKILGLPAGNRQAQAGCSRLLESGLYREREIRFSRGQKLSDLGVSGLVLSLCCYHGLGAPGIDENSLHSIASYLAAQQQTEGFWLAGGSNGDVSYRFETTLLILEGLLQYRFCFPHSDLPSSVETRAQECLLRHRLYLQEDLPIKKQWLSFSFPPYWFYDVLTALEYFRSFGTKRDPRLQSAVELVRRKRNPAGVWMSGRKHAGKTWIDMEQAREPSRWNTLRALRVLRWWGDEGLPHTF